MRRGITAGVLAAMLLVSGCSAPTSQYIAADAHGMYFALPTNWNAVAPRQLEKAESGWTDDAGTVFLQSVLWQGAWTASSANANQVFDAKAPSAPVAFAFVRRLLTVEQQGAADTTINIALRDLVIPATSITDAGGVVQAERLHVGAFRGLHQFTTYATGGTMQTVEVVSMLAPGKDRVYVLSVRCTEQCFDDNSGKINAVFDSLTFKEPRGQ